MRRRLSIENFYWPKYDPISTTFIVRHEGKIGRVEGKVEKTGASSVDPPASSVAISAVSIEPEGKKKKKKKKKKGSTTTGDKNKVKAGEIQAPSKKKAKKTKKATE